MTKIKNKFRIQKSHWNYWKYSSHRSANALWKAIDYFMFLCTAQQIADAFTKILSCQFHHILIEFFHDWYFTSEKSKSVNFPFSSLQRSWYVDSSTIKTGSCVLDLCGRFNARALMLTRLQVIVCDVILLPYVFIVTDNIFTNSSFYNQHIFISNLVWSFWRNMNDDYLKSVNKNVIQFLSFENYILNHLTFSMKIIVLWMTEKIKTNSTLLNWHVRIIKWNNYSK